MHKCAAVKSPLGAQTVLGDRHDPIRLILLQVQSAACGTRPRELSNGWGRKRNQSRIQPRNRAREMHLCSAVKSPLGAQTVLGDRHDPICEIFFKFSRPPAELARENFPTAGDASRCAQALQSRASEMGSMCRFSTLVAHFKQ